MTTVTSPSSTLAVADIVVQDQFNARELDTTSESFVQWAESIKTLGVLTPLSIREDAGRYLLVAGHRRLAAAKLHGIEQVPVTFVTDEQEATTAAAENIAREQLNPYEEARAVQRLLDGGYTDDGVAKALGWAKARVTARRKMLGLPESIQRAYGAADNGPHLTLATIDPLLTIHEKAPHLTEVVARYCWDNARLCSDLAGWRGGHTVQAAVREAENPELFAQRVGGFQRHHIVDLGLPGPAWTRVEIMTKKNEYAHFTPPEMAVDQARATGFIITLGVKDDAQDVIIDRDAWKAIVELAIDEAYGNYKGESSSAAQREKKEGAANDEARMLRQAQKEWKDTTAPAANLDLGIKLLDEVASVPVSLDVARFFVHGLIGPPSPAWLPNQAASRRLAISGYRLCVDACRSMVEQEPTKTGKERPAKLTYCDPDVAEEAMWKFLDGAKTAEDLFGRALVLFAMGHYAVQHAEATAKRWESPVPRSRDDLARKALEKIVGKHVPASVKKLRKAIAQAYTDAGGGAPSKL